MIDLPEVFEKHDNEYLNFEQIHNPLHNRPDLCAFLLLDNLCPKAGSDIISGGFV